MSDALMWVSIVLAMAAILICPAEGLFWCALACFGAACWMLWQMWISEN